MPVAQLDRASDSDSEGHRFDSCRAYRRKSPGSVRLPGIFDWIFDDENKRIFAIRMGADYRNWAKTVVRMVVR